KLKARTTGLEFESEAVRMQTPRMATLDFVRTFRPQLLGCLRKQVRRSAPKGASVSVAYLTFPMVGSAAADYRITMREAVKGQPRNYVIDYSALVVGRTELALTSTWALGPKTAAAYGDQLMRQEAALVAKMAKRAKVLAG